MGVSRFVDHTANKVVYVINVAVLEGKHFCVHAYWLSALYCFGEIVGVLTRKIKFSYNSRQIN